MANRLDYSNQNRSNKKAREGITAGEIKVFKLEAQALAERIAAGRPSKSQAALGSGPVKVFTAEEKAAYEVKLREMGLL